MKFVKRPVVIEAVQWTGSNLEEVKRFMSPEEPGGGGNVLSIETLEGRMVATEGDWIIRGIKGELYPCKPDIFEESYEEWAGEGE